MTSIIRLTAAVNKVNCANPRDCAEEIKQMLGEACARGCDIAVFPKLALCSPSCGTLFSNQSLLEDCVAALGEVQSASAEMDCYLLVGLAADDFGKAVSAMAVLYRGELIGLVPTLDNPPPFANGGYSPHLLSAETVFCCGELRFCVLSCSLSTLALRAAQAAQNGLDLIIVPAYSPTRAGFMDEVCESAKAASKAVGCAVAVVNGGVGDTSSPYVYSGFIAVYECGEELCREGAGYRSFHKTVDLDLDIIRSQKKVNVHTPHFHAVTPGGEKPGLLRPLAQLPFLPGKNAGAYLDELFALQVRSLAARMENIGITKLVLGSSGGLDSAAATLASAAALDTLGLPRENLVGVTMPGFGTSDRTHFNALCLLERVGATCREIPIREAVQRHFEDIGHGGRQDVVFENAQARERTQILLDIANALSGIVVGTGDLSEAALGFCTFAGDHIAGYNVNICIPKTLLRALVRHVGEHGPLREAGDIVADILDTPVSPELLPPDEKGEIRQKTEEILGPYELHDFFLYYFLKYRMRPEKICFYACVAFAGKLKPDFIRDKLRLFFRRLAAGQFKRSCAPDSAAITEVNLQNNGFYIPSDLDPSALLREIDGER